MTINRASLVSMNSATSAFVDAAPITPSDATPLTIPTRGIYVGGAGNISLVTLLGTTVTFTALPVGTVLNIKANQIRATGTTATNLIALF